MKFCPKCGAELKEGAKFCPTCGFQIPVEQSTQTPPPPVFEPQAAVNAFTDTFKGNTNIVQRVINILTKPKQEWQVISTETPDKAKLIFGYVLILALIPVIITFISYSFIIGNFSIGTSIIFALISLIISLSIVFFISFIVDALAPSFESEKNFDRSFQLLSYSFTPMWIISIFYLIPENIIFRLSQLLGFSLVTYLLITGLPLIKKTSPAKATGYGVLIGLAIMIGYYLLEEILKIIFSV